MTLPPLLLQLVVILGCARLLRMVLTAAGQPAVVGEMIAGFVLGPVVFGAVAPGLQAKVFGAESLPALAGLAQVGLVLFTFVIGAELRLPHGARKQIVDAAAVGIPSVIVPMVLGLGVAVLLHPALAPPGVGVWSFALFVAAALSVTALPVMARILKERSMTHSEVGRLALTAAAVADAVVWILLAVVVVVIGAGRDWQQVATLVAGLAVLTCVVLFGARPLVARSLHRNATDGRDASAVLAGLLIAVFACAYATEALGMHAVFGAFLFGASLPRDDRLVRTLVERIEYLAVMVLLPVFFALAGLSTTAGAFAGPGLIDLLLILLVAIVGKVAAAIPGARWAGMSWRSSLAVGALMNTRGLVELIVLKIGLDLGLIGREAFTMLMVMAIVTTLMTAPLLSLLGWTAPKQR